MIALSDETDELIAEYLETMDVQVRVASGYKSDSEGSMAFSAYPTTFVIGADGKILYKGSPYSLNSGVIKAALKGVKKSSNSYMAYSSQSEFSDKAVSKLSDLAGKGKMGKALKGVRALMAEAQGATAEQAKKFEAELAAYASLLQGQSESFITKREMVTGTNVLADLAKEFKGLDVGDTASKRLSEIEDDETLALEWKADMALIKAREFSAKKGLKKSVKKFEAVAKKYKSTSAAKKARALADKGRQPKK